MHDDDALRETEVSEQKEEASLAKSGMVVSCMTFISRISGLIREIVFAAIFGDGAEADAFFMAFRIPNFLRRLFAEGAFSQAFVPVLSEYRKKHSFSEVKMLIDHVAGRLSLVLIIITVLGVLAAPILASVYAAGYMDTPEKFTLLSDALRITFPYILLISLTGFAGSILNSYGRFAVPAITPVFLNLSLIACALLLSPMFDQPVIAIAWGVILAGCIQLMFQLPFLYHLKMIPRPRLKPKHEGVSKVIALMIPVMFSVSVGQVNLLIDTQLAAFIDGDGSVSWLYYSDRLMEMPLGMFAIAIATVILPSLSRIHAEQSHEKFSATLDWGLRCIILLAIPASLALFVLAEPLVVTLYQRGEFSVDSVSPTALALQAYSLGLLGFMAIKVLASAYFSRQDTKTPVRYGIIAMVSNVVFNLMLIGPLAHVGLALATSMSAFLNASLLLMGLLKSNVFHFQRSWWLFIARIILANLAMLLVLVVFSASTDQWLEWGTWSRVWHLGLLCFGGIGCYGVALLLVGVRVSHFKH
jgi:putative peptidoglycan lipid II flippase